MRKIEIVTSVAVVLILCAGYFHFRSEVVAQTATETESDLRGRIQTFFAALNAQSGPPDTLIAYQRLLVSGSRTQDTDTMATMVQMTDDMIKGGNRWNHEFLDSKSVGNDLIQLRYLYKSDTEPFVWYFTFYRSQIGTRPGESFPMIPPTAPKWNCIHIRFDNDLDALFKGN